MSKSTVFKENTAKRKGRVVWGYLGALSISPTGTPKKCLYCFQSSSSCASKANFFFFLQYGKENSWKLTVEIGTDRGKKITGQFILKLFPLMLFGRKQNNVLSLITEDCSHGLILKKLHIFLIKIWFAKLHVRNGMLGCHPLSCCIVIWVITVLSFTLSRNKLLLNICH